MSLLLLPLLWSEHDGMTPQHSTASSLTGLLAAFLQHLKEQAGEQRNALAQLAASTSLHLEPGAAYALVPRPWLAAWRAFLGASGRRVSGEADRPPPLPRAVADTFCTCHPGDAQRPALLCVQPPAVVKRYMLGSMCVI